MRHAKRLLAVALVSVLAHGAGHGGPEGPDGRLPGRG